MPAPISNSTPSNNANSSKVGPHNGRLPVAAGIGPVMTVGEALARYVQGNSASGIDSTSNSAPDAQKEERMVYPTPEEIVRRCTELMDANKEKKKADKKNDAEKRKADKENNAEKAKKMDKPAFGPERPAT